ncbi:MAG: flavin reductase family protein [Promethearchaeota archaeon]
MINAKMKATVTIPFERSLYLLHPYNTCLITSKGKDEKINIMAVAWITPVSVKPPLIAMSIHPERYSYNLIIERGEFIINIPQYEQAQTVLFCGRYSGRDTDKFQKVPLTPEKAKRVKVPRIMECIAHLECKVVKTIELGDHVLVIGKIIEAYALSDCFNEVYNITKFRPCLHIGKNLFTTCIKETIEPTL